MAHCNLIDQDGAVTDDSAQQDDQQPAYSAAPVFALLLTEREAAYIRYRMYKAKQENGGKARKRAAAIHAALKLAGVPA